MKIIEAFTLLAGASALVLQESADRESPIEQVLGLLTGLKTELEGEETNEHRGYDKFACWVENTLKTTSQAIQDGKDQIDALTIEIREAKARVATLSSGIAELEKAIAENDASTKDARDQREKDHKLYLTSLEDTNMRIAALQEAQKILADATSSDTMDAIKADKGTRKLPSVLVGTRQLVNVAASIRQAVSMPIVEATLPARDMDLLRKFVDAPDRFIGQAQGVSAVQLRRNNPYGDYAPASGRVQGILAGLEDTMVALKDKLEKTEAEQVKAHEEQMKIKTMEKETLQATLLTHNTDHAATQKELALAVENKNDAVSTLAADEQMNANTKASGKERADQFSQRSRLRSEELGGISQAIDILTKHKSSGGKGFFLQLSSRSRSSASASAFKTLDTLAAQYGSASLAQVAAKVKVGGHFDEVIASIDTMITHLAQQEKEDIQIRDACQGAANNDKNVDADHEYEKEKQGDLLTQKGSEKDTLETHVKTLGEEIGKIQGEMDTATMERTAAKNAFKAGLSENDEAIKAINEAIAVLSKFYAGAGAALLQDKEDPGFKDGNYKGKQSEGTNIISILEMIREDFVREMKTSKNGDVAGQAAYEKAMASMAASKASKQGQLNLAEKTLAEVLEEIQEIEGVIGDEKAEQELAEKKAAANAKRCEWVSLHFEDRAVKRKNEIEGLTKAKHILAGMESEVP